MIPLLSAFIFMLGLIIGSGINALVYRVHSGKSFLRGRSLCPNCKHQLAVLDLIPVVSYLILKGKCQYCHKPIHWQYPAIELLTATSFTLFFLYSQYIQLAALDSSIMMLRLLVGFVFISYLVFILLYDALYLVIPDSALLSLAPIALLGSWLVFGLDIGHVAIGAAIGFGFFGVMFALSRGRWIGFGDVKFGLVLGMMLGIYGIAIDLFFAYVIGSLFALYILGTKKKHLKDRIAFGPFLALGALVALIFGQAIAVWYVGLL